VDVYTHEGTDTTALNSKVKKDGADIDNPNVFGKKYTEQAASIKEFTEEMKWTAGTTHVPSTAPASTTAGNTAYPCYMYKELKKLGRNPNDFGKKYDITLGYRIYKTAAATTYDTATETSSTIDVPAMQTYS